MVAFLLVSGLSACFVVWWKGQLHFSFNQISISSRISRCPIGGRTKKSWVGSAALADAVATLPLGKAARIFQKVINKVYI